MDTSTLQRLTLAYPPALEEQLIDVLLEQRPELPGFTTLACDGHGGNLMSAAVHEQVRGRVRRRLLMMVMPAAGVATLLATLREQLPTSEVAWWLEPVVAFGRLA